MIWAHPATFHPGPLTDPAAQPEVAPLVEVGQDREAGQAYQDHPPPEPVLGSTEIDERERAWQHPERGRREKASKQRARWGVWNGQEI